MKLKIEIQTEKDEKFIYDSDEYNQFNEAIGQFIQLYGCQVEIKGDAHQGM